MYKSLGKLNYPWTAQVNKACNPNNFLFTLNRLARNRDYTVRMAAMSSISMNLAEGMKASKIKKIDSPVLATAIAMARTLGEKLPGQQSCTYMDALSRFIRNAGAGEIEIMIQSKLPFVRKSIAEAGNCPKHILMDLACEDASYAMSAWWQLKTGGTLTNDDLSKIFFRCRNSLVREGVPMHSAASIDLLDRIANGPYQKAAELAEMKLSTMGITSSYGGLNGDGGMDSTFHSI